MSNIQSRKDLHSEISELLTMTILASTAERKARTYTTAKGFTRTIKGRPARRGFLPMGESTIWEKVRRGEFPKPVKISSRITAWKRAEILEWLESKQ